MRALLVPLLALAMASGACDLMPGAADTFAEPCPDEN